MSCEPEGCVAVQQAIEQAADDALRNVLASELRGRVQVAMRHVHANHVLQTCIRMLKPHSIQFIVDEIMDHGKVCKVARDMCGCRVLQRLLEYCRPDQLEGLVDCLLIDAIALSLHIYGKYVMQHVLEHGASSQRQNLMNQLQRHASTIVYSTHGPVVLAKALSHMPLDKSALVGALLREKGYITVLAKNRHCSSVIHTLLQSVDEPLLEELRRQLSADASLLGKCRHGRETLKHLTAQV